MAQIGSIDQNCVLSTLDSFGKVKPKSRTRLGLVTILVYS